MTGWKDKTPFWIYGAGICLLPALSVFSVNVYGSVPVVLFALALSHAFAVKARPKPDPALLFFCLFLPLLALASALWSPWPGGVIEKSLKAMMIWGSGLGLYLLSGSIPAPQAARVQKCFPAAVGAAMLLVMEELLLNHPLHRLLRGIPLDAHVIPSVVNHGAVVLSLLFWPFLYLKMRTDNFALGVCVGLSFFAFLVLFGKSETAMAAMAAGAVVFAAEKRFPALVHALLAAGVPLLILAAPWVFRWGFEHVAPLLEGWEGASAGARFDIWNAVSDYALCNPAYGFGMEATRHIQDFAFAGLYDKRDFVLHPHNNILQLWIEFGVLGAAWAAAFALFLLRRIRLLPPLERAAVTACFAAAFTIALVGYGLWQSWWAGALFLVALTFAMIFKGEFSSTRPI